MAFFPPEWSRVVESQISSPHGTTPNSLVSWCKGGIRIWSPGLRNRGAPKKRFKDTLKMPLGACNISHLEWTTLAKDRGTWRHTINKAASSFKSSQRTAIEEKRQRRKNSAATTPNPDETFTRCHCNWTC